MSLEEEIRKNTASNEKLAAELAKNTEMLAAITGKTAGSTGRSSSRTADKDDKSEKDEKPAGRRGPGRPPKEKAKTSTEMAEIARKFAEAAQDDEDEFRARRKFLTSLADEFKVEKFSAIADPKDQADAIEALKKYEDDDGGDGEGEGEGDY